jgi:pyruvate,orthophosphate dikinase
VAGIRTPSPINDDTKNEQNRHLVSMQHAMPEIYRELDAIRTTLEKHFTDMLDLEFTILEGKLWMLQCRVGKRNGTAALNMAMDMLKEETHRREASRHAGSASSSKLLYPIIDPKTEKTPVRLSAAAGPGAACGAWSLPQRTLWRPAAPAGPASCCAKRPIQKTSKGCVRP